ncbi:hypothetical protein IWX46DRAFT_600880 [Phyllosticta citricarpa]|uniref:Secreted protein n=1 Tax=Phyllosticta citricarpa TaxID=55181 RepID=A0ABR1MCS7_9PEZI
MHACLLACLLASGGHVCLSIRLSVRVLDSSVRPGGQPTDRPTDGQMDGMDRLRTPATPSLTARRIRWFCVYVCMCGDSWLGTYIR